MRFRRLLCSGLAAVLALLAGPCLAIPAGAESSSLRAVSDPWGRFTISVPAGWQVKSLQGGQPALTAHASEAGWPSLWVAAETAAFPRSSEEFARSSVQGAETVYPGLAVVQEGPTQLGGYPAYYLYYTWRAPNGTAVMQVQTYLSIGTRRFVVTGTTWNKPERIRTDIPLLLQLIATFRPSPAPK